MRVRKWEKWYLAIALCLTIIVPLGIMLFGGEGFEMNVNGKTKIVEKSTLALWWLFLTPISSFLFWVWLRVAIGFFSNSNDFVCKRCKKEYGRSWETEKELCKKCYEKKYN